MESPRGTNEFLHARKNWENCCAEQETEERLALARACEALRCPTSPRNWIPPTEKKTLGLVTQLLVAATKNDCSALTTLLQEERVVMKILEFRNIDADSILHILAREGHEQALQMTQIHCIITTYHWSWPESTWLVNIRNAWKQTPLHIAIDGSVNPAIAILLLKAGASPFRKNEYLETPFLLACALGWGQVVELMLREPERLSRSKLNLPNRDGLTALQLADQRGHDVARFVRSILESNKLLP